MSKNNFQKSRCSRSLPTSPRKSFYTQDQNGKGTGCQQAADQLPVLYLIFRAGGGVDAGVGRAYGVRDF